MLISAEFEGAAEALFLAHPSKKCKVAEMPVIPKDGYIRHYVDGRKDNLNHEFSNEEIEEARQESDEAMRLHFRKVGLR